LQPSGEVAVPRARARDSDAPVSSVGGELPSRRLGRPPLAPQRRVKPSAPQALRPRRLPLVDAAAATANPPRPTPRQEQGQKIVLNGHGLGPCSPPSPPPAQQSGQARGNPGWFVHIVERVGHENISEPRLASRLTGSDKLALVTPPPGAPRSSIP
jgi:hypothetical protein